MRKRLSWDEEKTAEIMKQADPYTMNQTRQNPPVEKYQTGDPSAWAEDQNKNTPWEQEGRTETGHPAPARQAVVQAKQLEDKALKCITIAQRMLPGAEEMVVEDQATDLMFLPEHSIMATLQRQTELAAKIAAESKEEEKKSEEVEAKKAPVEEKKPEEVEAKKAPVEEKKPEEVEAKKAPVEEKKPEEVEAKKVPVEEKKPEEVEAKKVPVEEKKPEEVEAKKEEKKPEEKEVSASDKDLLDVLFDSAEIVPQPKTGAKTLTGLVKQASTGEDALAGLWDTPPDVSAVFGKNR
jgi:hypothetical protein